MAALVDGVWTQQEHFPTDARGAFRRAAAQFRDRVSLEPGARFPWKPGRYVLYLSHACPWCHRVNLVRTLLGLQDALPIAVANPFMGEHGWEFGDAPGAIRDPSGRFTYAYEVYQAADPDHTGRATVPILWDTETGTIVNNESRDLIRMLGVIAGGGESPFAPKELAPAIDRWIDANYETVNNGVYKCGFARSQEAYEAAFDALFAQLAVVEQHLSEQRYLCGARLTEADLCLFPTLLRFDAVYVTHFKCNAYRIVDRPNLWGWTRDVFQTPSVAETCRLDHIKEHYFRSHESINPMRIVAKGPQLDFAQPHERARLS